MTSAGMVAEPVARLGRPTAPRLALLAFVLPGTLFLLVTMGSPMAYVVGTSLFDLNFAQPERGSPFIGLGNYFSLASDGRFWNAIFVTALFTFFVVTIEFLLGLAIALLLRRVTRARRPAVALLLIPTMMMPVAVGLMWRFMLDDTYGMVAYYLKSVGLPGARRADH